MRGLRHPRWHHDQTMRRALLLAALTLGLAPLTARALCVGACADPNQVTIDNIITLVNISLDLASPSACAAGLPPDAPVTIDVIIQAVNHSLTGCPVTEVVCGNGAAEPGEECDDGGLCFGSEKAGSTCYSEADCGAGNGKCVSGEFLGMSCPSDAACGSGGKCVKCVPVGGDSCAANCTVEQPIAYTLKPGELSADRRSIKPGTSGVVLHTSVLGNLNVLLSGTQTLLSGKDRGDGVIPFVVKASSTQFAAAPILNLGCMCLRAVAAKSCGGVTADFDGTKTIAATDCSPDYTAGDSVCTEQGKPPCAVIHGFDASGSGAVGCSGLPGVDYSSTQDAGFNTGIPGDRQVVFGGIGGPGAALLITSIAIATVDNANPSDPCKGNGPNFGPDKAFCTDDDPQSVRSTPATLPETTGAATADITDSQNGNPAGGTLGPYSITGRPFVCSGGTVDVASGGFVGAASTLKQTLGDIVSTNQFFAQ